MKDIAKEIGKIIEIRNKDRGINQGTVVVRVDKDGKEVGQLLRVESTLVNGIPGHSGFVVSVSARPINLKGMEPQLEGRISMEEIPPKQKVKLLGQWKEK